MYNRKVLNLCQTHYGRLFWERAAPGKLIWPLRAARTVLFLCLGPGALGVCMCLIFVNMICCLFFEDDKLFVLMLCAAKIENMQKTYKSHQTNFSKISGMAFSMLFPYEKPSGNLILNNNNAFQKTAYVFENEMVFLNGLTTQYFRL